MTLTFLFHLDAGVFPGAGANAVMLVEIDLPDGAQPELQDPSRSNGTFDWRQDLDGAAARLRLQLQAEPMPADLKLNARLTGQQVILFQTTTPITADGKRIACVLLTGQIEFPAGSVKAPALVPPAAQMLALQVHPSGLLARVVMPAAFFPPDVAIENQRTVVLRLPQRADLDWEIMDERTDTSHYCWTLGDQTLPGTLWTAQEWLKRWCTFLESAPGIDSVALDDSTRPQGATVVRLGLHDGTLRWVMRTPPARITLATGDGESRTSEVHFKPDALVGAYDSEGRPAIPVQFVAVPRRAGRHLCWLDEPRLAESDYVLQFGETLLQKLTSQRMRAMRGPVRAGADGRNLDEAWLGIADGWLALRGPRLLGELETDRELASQQLTGVFDPVAWAAATGTKATPPQMRLQFTAVDYKPPENKVEPAFQGTQIVLTLPNGKAGIGFHLWRPRILLTTPPHWRKHPAAPRPAVDAAAETEPADRLVPSLAPPPETTLDAYLPAQHFGHFVFMSEASAITVLTEEDPPRHAPAGLAAIFTTDFSKTWTLEFDAPAEAWRLPGGIPIAPNHPLVESPRHDALLDDRRGLVPFTRAGGEALAVEFPYIDQASSPLPRLTGDLGDWRGGPKSGWQVATRLSYRRYFLPTLPGVEFTLKSGKPVTDALRHANPALDESYAAVTEDQDDRRLDTRLECDPTRVEEALSFSALKDGTVPGWLPGKAVTVTKVKPALTGTAPQIAFTITDPVEANAIDVTLTRPTTGNRHSNLIQLGMSVDGWSDDLQMPTVKLKDWVQPSPRKAGEPTVKPSAIVGGGQPLLVRNHSADHSLVVLDGRGDLFESGRERRRELRGGKARTRITATWQLGDPAHDDLVLELCGVAFGQFESFTREELLDQRWQLRSKDFGAPKFRGFGVRPVLLESLDEGLAVLVVRLIHPTDVESTRDLRLRFEGDQGKLTTVRIVAEPKAPGGVEWCFPPVADTTVVRFAASFPTDVKLSDEPIKLALDALELVLPFGRVPMHQGTCVFLPDPDNKRWIIAVQAADDEKLGTSDNVRLEHATGWIVVDGKAINTPLKMLWTDLPSTAAVPPGKTSWRIAFGQAESLRPAEVLKWAEVTDSAAALAKIAALVTVGKISTSTLVEELVAAIQPAKANSRLKARIDFLVESIIGNVDQWLAAGLRDGEWDQLANALKERKDLTTRLQQVKRLAEVTESALDLSYLRRECIAVLLAGAAEPSGDWRRRWCLQLHHADAPTRRGLIGDARLDAVRFSADRCTFQITRDAFRPAQERRDLSRHLRFDNLGGVLGTTLVRDQGHLFIARVAVQLQLILRDSLRRDALAVWNHERRSLLIREDQIGPVHAFAAYAQTVPVPHRDLIWASSGSEGRIAFHQWIPAVNRVKSLIDVTLKPGNDGVPRRVLEMFPFFQRKALVVDDAGRVSLLTLLKMPDPADAAGAETIISLKDEPRAAVKLIVTNYPFDGKNAGWTREGQKGCWRFFEDEVKKRFEDLVEIVAFWYGTVLLVATANTVTADVDGGEKVALDKVQTPEGGEKTVLFEGEIVAIASAEGAPLILVRKTKFGFFLDWYRGTTRKTMKRQASEIPLDLAVEQLLPLGPDRVAVRGGARVVVIEYSAADQKDGRPPRMYDIDAGSLTPSEIDLLDESEDNHEPSGDLLLRGPAAGTLATAILTFDADHDADLELSGRIVLQNDLHFEEQNAAGAAADCTHRADLHLDRARLPVTLLFGSTSEDHFVAAVVHHVFRFSNGEERIWQAPQLVRFTNVERAVPGLVNPDADDERVPLNDGEKKSLVIDATAVVWLEKFANTKRHPGQTPFDARARGGGEVMSPFFNIRLHSKPRGAFQDAAVLTVPFLASTAFPKLGNGKPDVLRFRIPADASKERLRVGSQFPLLSPRLVAAAGDRDGIEFHARTLQGRWIASDFLRYSLLPEVPLRHAISREMIPGPAPLPPDFAPAEPNYTRAMIDAMADGLAVLRGFSVTPIEVDPVQRGDRRFLAAATLARKVDKDELTGPALVEFPFHIDLEAQTDEAVDASLPEGIGLADLTPANGVDLQLIVHRGDRLHRVARETFATPKQTVAQNSADAPYVAWAHRQREQLGLRSEAFLVVDYHRIVPIDPAPEVNAELLASAVPAPGTAAPVEDPRCVPYSAATVFTADADQSIEVFRAEPVTDETGRAPAVSATHWWLAALDGNTPALAPAKPFETVESGWTARHAVPFELAAAFPASPASRIRRLDLPKEADAHPMIRPPSWQLVAWSDRPGEAMVSRFRGVANDTSSVAVSADRSLRLRRSRTATPVGATVRLQKRETLLPAAWNDWSAAFAPREFTLFQTLRDSRVPDEKACLFISDDQTVTTGTATPDASAANPVLVNMPSTRMPVLHIVAGMQWPAKPANNTEVVYVVRRSKGLGKFDDDLATADAAADFKKAQDAGNNAVFLVVDLADAAALRFASKPLFIPDDEGTTLTLVQYMLDKNPPTPKLSANILGAIGIAPVNVERRIKPLKTAVAVLAGADAKVRLCGYGLLGPDRFTPIEPVAGSHDDVDGTSVVHWRRTAAITVMERNPDPKTATYSVVVTGPSGETYPETPEA